MGRAKLLPEELRQSNCLALIASEVLMALNVVNDAQHALGKDVNPEAFGIMEHARGHLIRGLDMFSYEVRKATKPDCTIGDYGFNIVDVLQAIERGE